MKLWRALLVCGLSTAAAATWAGTASAWDSICYQYTDPTLPVAMLQPILSPASSRGCSGIDAARGRFRDPVYQLDEHRVIFALAAGWDQAGMPTKGLPTAGLPASVLETQLLRVLTMTGTTGVQGALVQGASGPTPTVAPVPLIAAERAVVRAFSLDELAQLPDFSYSLADWDGGNETCPLDLPAAEMSAQACHTFSSHMGATNSNHFPPQSDKWSAYYHNLALGRALECQKTRAKVWSAQPAALQAATDARLASTWQACEVEALAYEAVAQHYLQDSWSSGHLWQRWGTTDLSVIPNLMAQSGACVPSCVLDPLTTCQVVCAPKILAGNDTCVPSCVQNPLAPCEVACAGYWSAASNAWNGATTRLRQLLIAEIVAVAAGTIHGVDPVLFEAEVCVSETPEGVNCPPLLAYLDGVPKDWLPKKDWLALHDPLCFPDAREFAVFAGQNNVAGDLHLHDVVGGLPMHSTISSTALPYSASVLDGQSKQLLGCAAGSLGAVYALLGDAGSYGSPVLGAATVPPPPFDAATCSAPAVTNQGFFEGILAIPDVVAQIGQLFPGTIQHVPLSVNSAVRNDFGRVRAAAWFLAKAKPDGTEMSQLYLSGTYDAELCVATLCKTVTYTPSPRLFTLLGVKPNRCYAANAPAECQPLPPPPPAGLPATFADPALSAWKAGATLPSPLPAPDYLTSAGAQALVFHASRAPQLCNATTGDDLKHLVAVVAQAKTPTDLANACDACAEWVVPFLRVGTGAGAENPSAEPLCYFTAADQASVPYVYEPAGSTADPLALARQYCGCKGLVAVTDAGLQRLSVVTSPSGNAASFTRVGALVPVGPTARGVASASQGRLLVTNGSGEIVGIQGDYEVDLDGNPANGITRLTFDGAGMQAVDLGAITVTNVNNKELVLVVTQGTGELIAYDLGQHTLCKRLNVFQVAGQGATGVVVSADLSHVWVSLSQTSPLSGAIADVDLAALAECKAAVKPSVTWVATPWSTTPPTAAVEALGPMALSPDGTRLAIGGQLAGECSDNITLPDGSTMGVSVGCDRILVMDTATRTFLTFGTNINLPTRPGRLPTGIAWLEDSVRLAFSSHDGIELGGSDSGWPAWPASTNQLPSGGTLRLADTSGPNYSGGGGGASRYWTYNMPLDALVSGPTVVTQGGVAGGPAWVYVATASGLVAGYAVAAQKTSDPMWEGDDTDPETQYHVTPNGAWYGGCGHPCELPGGVCPDVCPGGSVPPGSGPAEDPPELFATVGRGFGSINLGSNVRVMTSY